MTVPFQPPRVLAWEVTRRCPLACKHCRAGAANIRYSRHLRSVMAPCGMLVTEERLTALKEAGVMACSFSLDGPDAASHDAFRGVAGAYDSVTRAMRIAHAIKMPFQVNVTVSTCSMPLAASCLISPLITIPPMPTCLLSANL